MKKSLLALGLSLSSLAFSQSTNLDCDSTKMTPSEYEYCKTLESYINQTAKVKPKPILSAGDELITATNRYYKGMTVVAIGLLPIIYTNTKNSNEGTRTAITVIGGITSLIGVIMQIESHIHIKRAGLILNQSGIGIRLKI